MVDNYVVMLIILIIHLHEFIYLLLHDMMMQSINDDSLLYQDVY